MQWMSTVKAYWNKFSSSTRKSDACVYGPPSPLAALASKEPTQTPPTILAMWEDLVEEMGGSREGASYFQHICKLTQISGLQHPTIAREWLKARGWMAVFRTFSPDPLSFQEISQLLLREDQCRAEVIVQDYLAELSLTPPVEKSEQEPSHKASA